MWRFFLILSISLSVIVAQESANPCDALTEDQFFAPNPRGCGMYFYCGDNNIPKPGLCPHDLHFHFVNQSCEFPEDVNCTIDDELWVKTCPGIGITKVPHEYSCSEYSVCLDNQQVDRECPPGLHFSPYDQDCVYPEYVNCKTDQITCEGSNPFVPLYIPSSRNCRAYYICFNNALHTATCAENQVFDTTTNLCVPSSLAECEQTLNPDLEVPESLSLDCSNYRNGSRIPHPEHCKFWFWCVNGRSQLFWCGKDALFDSVTRLCAEQNQSVCGNINGNTAIEVHDRSDQMELKIMPASEQKTLFSVIQPKLKVLRSGHKNEDVRMKDKAKVIEAFDDKKPEKFYGLF